MNIEAEYASSLMELSKPIGRMSWDEAMIEEWTEGWRVPTRVELVALLSEAVKASYEFEDKTTVWSASSYTPNPTFAWRMGFHFGISFADFKAKELAIRLIRDVQRGEEMKMAAERAAIAFGALAPKLSEQIPGIHPRWDEIAHGIGMAQIWGILTDAETARARKRIMKAIRKEVKG